MTYVQRIHGHDEIACPVSDNLLARVIRADATEIAKIAAALPEAVRSRLAAFCYLRAHFREIGRDLASLCEASSLIREVGPTLGNCLVELKPEHPPQRSHTRTPAKITLASLRDMASISDEMGAETFETA